MTRSRNASELEFSGVKVGVDIGLGGQVRKLIVELIFKAIRNCISTGGVPIYDIIY